MTANHGTRWLFVPHSGTRGERAPLLALLAALAVLAAWVPAAGAAPTKVAYGKGRIVPIPAAIPHSPGDMVDSRIVSDLRWLAKRYPIYVTDGYSGRLPGGGRHVGCRGCHVRGSDHHNGLAVDVVALGGGARCDRAWRGITRLARWAEPRQNRPRSPFRWVGYDGDAGHGCGHHLHLSWEHSVVRQWRIAEWVEVLSLRGAARPVPAEPKPAPTSPTGPRGGARPGSGPIGGSSPQSEASSRKPAAGPPGGVSSASRSGGLAPRGD